VCRGVSVFDVLLIVRHSAPQVKVSANSEQLIALVGRGSHVQVCVM
jgi:hypothetical protein